MVDAVTHLTAARARLVVSEPFPESALRDAYEWSRYTTTALSATTYTKPQYLQLMSAALATPGARSWGLRQAGDLVGMVFFEPIYRLGELVDGSIHILLARRAWGLRLIEQAAQVILPALFDETPSLLRLSGFTPSTYRPGLHVAAALGFEVEGTWHEAVRIGGRLRDITLTGLTRTNYGNIRRP